MVIKIENKKSSGSIRKQGIDSYYIRSVLPCSNQMLFNLLAVKLCPTAIAAILAFDFDPG